LISLRSPLGENPVFSANCSSECWFAGDREADEEGDRFFVFVFDFGFGKGGLRAVRPLDGLFALVDAAVFDEFGE